MIKQTILASALTLATVTMANAEFLPEVEKIFDLLKQGQRECSLRIDKNNVPCNVVWFVVFKDGSNSIQFNKETGDNSVVTLFGVVNGEILSISTVQTRIGNSSSAVDEEEATGQCVLTKATMKCQARTKGHLLVGNVVLKGE
jgi:hypothetical protein